jgi:hypothetical protein
MIIVVITASLIWVWKWWGGLMMSGEIILVCHHQLKQDFFYYMNKIELNKIYLKREFMLYFVFYTMMNEFELYIYIY